MGFAEKNQWAYGLAALAVGGTYFTWLFTQVGGALSVADIGYVRPLLWAIAAGIIANVVFSAFVRGSNQREADKTDERDRNVGRFADQISFIAFSVYVLGPFVLALLDADTFWIANTIYAAYVLAAITGVVARSVIYRKGA